ncbi:MAG: type II 3-dehydroquinate dehydratase [Hyphomicrobiales bacterium]|nr:type II 3-dehydroquinate dehydratase [Hyphomicrobiales bacterium]
MAHLVYILNGPNLNLLGQRQPQIYGHETLADIEATCSNFADAQKIELRFHQSNAEHQLIDWIHEARTTASGMIINPGAYSHSSIAILDALNACEFPVIEVHISNIHKRESFRHHSFISERADGIIVGCGAQGYMLGLQRLATLFSQPLPGS